jgi:hypothetical protein
MSFKYPLEVPFVAEVTRFNNTQNALKIADFRSNDAVQKDLARKFEELNLMGRKYEYKNKRGDKKRGTIAVAMEDFTKAVFAFKFGPDDMYGGTSKLFDTSAGGQYTKVFQHPDEPLPHAQFTVLAGTFLACDYVKALWEKHRKELRAQDKTMHPALERKNLIYFAIGELLRESYSRQKEDLNHDIAKLAKPNDWLADANSKPSAALRKAFDISGKVLRQQYDNKKTNPDFKHRNWFRDSATLSDIRNGLDIALEFGLPPRLW